MSAPEQNPFSAPRTEAEPAPPEDEDLAFFEFAAARVSRVTWFFVLYYLVAGALSALTGGVVALVGGLILAAIQTGLALGTRRRPRPMMLATAGLFGVLILPPLVTNPLSVISFGPILGIVLIVYGVREAEDLRKLMAASRGGR